jgi:hypothetical protein
MGRASRRKRERGSTDKGIVGASEEHVLGFHLVGFFDLLGQSSHLRHLTRLPETQAEREATVRLLKQTAGTVIAVREMFRDVFVAMDEPTSFARSLRSDHRQQVAAATQAKLTYWGVSDSIIVAVSLRDADHPCTPVNGVYRSFVAAAGMWLLSLSINHPLRGGIEVGLGIDIAPGEVYGPALDCAYRLESTVAQGPRIVVGDLCMDYLRSQLERQNATDLTMLRRDLDGTVVLDPLGDRMLAIARTMAGFGADSIADRVAPAHNVVRQQLADAEASNNQKLVDRYRRLMAYFDEHASAWKEHS